MADAVVRTEAPGFPVTRGKVRDVYDLGDALAIVATDRVSAFDWVMAEGVPGKGTLLTALTRFWLEFLGEPNHFLSDDLRDLPVAFQRPEFAGRTMKVKKARVIPVECVARGYLVGSGWQGYRQAGEVCGHALPAGLVEAQRLTTPLFTPATKAEPGAHDENISRATLAARHGAELAQELEARTLRLYARAAEYAADRGLILADTKFEFGTLPDGEIILIDEVLTPDSSRYWPADEYRAGTNPPSFDKQYLRDWLLTTGWDRDSPPPSLPPAVVEAMVAKYREAHRRLVGRFD